MSNRTFGTVTKRKGKPGFSIRVSLGDGSRVLRHAGDDEAAAESALRRIEDKVKYEGVEILAAVNQVLGRGATTTGGVTEEMTFVKAAKMLRDEYTAHGKHSALYVSGLALKHGMFGREAWANKPLAKVTPAEIRTYVECRRGSVVATSAGKSEKMEAPVAADGDAARIPLVKRMQDAVRILGFVKVAAALALPKPTLYEWLAKRGWGGVPAARWADVALRAAAIDKALADAAKATGVRRVCGSTLNRDKAAMSIVWTWAINKGYATANPCDSLKSYGEADRARFDHFSPDEADAIVDASSDSLHPFTLLAFDTSWRMTNLRMLREKDVDLDAVMPGQTLVGTITADPDNDKAGYTRMIPLTPRARAMLVMLFAQRTTRDPEALIFPGRSADGTRGREGLRIAFKRAVRDAGISGARGRRVTFHTMRHTTATLLIRAGVPKAQVMYMLGHKTSRMTDRYNHFTPGIADAAVGALVNVYAASAQKQAGKV